MKDKEWLIKRLENYVPAYERTVGGILNGVLAIAKQLDEPEILSQEWIEKHKEYVRMDPHGWDTEQYAVAVGDLQNLLVPKQEELVSKADELKPVVPQFVADWMEKYIDYGYDLYPALKRMENNSRSWIMIYEWYRENTFEFVIAYLTKEYVVEKPKHPILQAFDEKVKEYESYGSTSMRMAEVRKVLVEALEEEEE